MKQLLIIILLLTAFIEPATANLTDFFFVPQRRRVVFVEDYYNLYRKDLYGDTAAHLANIYYLRLGLKAAETNRWWIHPTKSFAYVRYDWANPPRKRRHYFPFRKDDPPFTQAHHAKYRELMKMRISLLITKSYLELGSRYDRENLYWFNSKDYEDLPYIKRGKNHEHYLIRSFRIAETCYKEAQKYWDRTKKYVRICWEGNYKYTEPYMMSGNDSRTSVPYVDIDLQGIEMDQMEDEVYKIYHGGNLTKEAVDPELVGQVIAQDPKYLKKVKRYKEEEKHYFNKENYPEYNYDKIISEKIKALDHKRKKLKVLIKAHKIKTK
ncbi:MAG: hypothetical protein IEMM0008_0505 [bacterium]|nr:MAG: hypothetical protein IEMM0008_0505 [bacterium]